MSGVTSRVVVVTGGANGIGEATVRRFADEGYGVVIADLDEEAGVRVAEELGDRATFVRADASDERQFEALLETAAALGPVRCLVNCAGIGAVDDGITTISTEEFDRLLTTNLKSAFLGVRGAARLMRGNGGGAIVNVGSIAGLQAGIAHLSYSVSKAAVIHLTRCAALELAEHHIRVNCVCPGMVATDLFARVFEVPEPSRAAAREEADRIFSARQPYPTAVRPADVARAIAWLGGADSDPITGEVLPIDGGLSLGQRWSSLVSNTEYLRRRMTAQKE